MTVKDMFLKEYDEISNIYFDERNEIVSIIEKLNYQIKIFNKKLNLLRFDDEIGASIIYKKIEIVKNIREKYRNIYLNLFDEENEKLEFVCKKYKRINYKYF